MRCGVGFTGRYHAEAKMMLQKPSHSLLVSVDGSTTESTRNLEARKDSLEQDKKAGHPSRDCPALSVLISILNHPYAQYRRTERKRVSHDDPVRNRSCGTLRVQLHQLPLLCGIIQVLPDLHVRPVGRAAAANVQCFPAMDVNQFIETATCIDDPP